MTASLIIKRAKNLFVAIAMLLGVLSFSASAIAQSTGPAAPPASGEESWTDMFFGEGETDFAAEKAKNLEWLESLPCPTCSIFAQFAESIFQAAWRVDGAGAGLRAVLTGFASVFGLYYLGSAFVSGDASDLLGRWQTFWRLCLAVCAGSIFLGSPLSYSWDYIFGPLFSIGEGLVNMVGGGATDCSGVFGGTMSVSIEPAGAANAVASMSRTVCGSYKMTLSGIASGFALMQQSGSIMEGIVFTIAGIMVVILYGFLAITFPLRFIDVVVKLGIIGFLTPILGVCAVFKPTRGYVGIAISNVLNATAQFAILSIIFRIGDNVMTGIAEDLQIGGGDYFIISIMNAFIMFGTAYVFVSLTNSVPAIASEIARHSGGGASDGGKAAVGMAGKPMAVAAAATGGAGRLAVGAAVNKAMMTQAVATGLGKVVK